MALLVNATGESREVAPVHSLAPSFVVIPADRRVLSSLPPPSPLPSPPRIETKRERDSPRAALIPRDLPTDRR